MELKKIRAVVLLIVLTIVTYTLYYPKITPIDPVIFFMSFVISIIITDLTYPYIKKLWE
jgi:hypothetical protein